MGRRVLFHPSAQRELIELLDYILDQGSRNGAERFVGEIREFCLGLVTFPERGSRRDDIAPGVRIVGFRKRVSVVFR